MSVIFVDSKYFFSGSSDTIYGTWDDGQNPIAITKDFIEIGPSKTRYTLMGKGFEDNSVCIFYFLYNEYFNSDQSFFEQWTIIPNGAIQIYTMPEYPTLTQE